MSYKFYTFIKVSFTQSFLWLDKTNEGTLRAIMPEGWYIFYSFHLQQIKHRGDNYLVTVLSLDTSFDRIRWAKEGRWSGNKSRYGQIYFTGVCMWYLFVFLCSFIIFSVSFGLIYSYIYIWKIATMCSKSSSSARICKLSRISGIDSKESISWLLKSLQNSGSEQGGIGLGTFLAWPVWKHKNI